ncbi:MAG: tyrosine-type recombinase/integrase [Cucumibacter sp.]
MRTVPIGAAVATMLKEWKLRSTFKKPDDLVFPNKRGTYVGHDNMVKRQFLSLFDAAAEKHQEDPTKHPAVERFNWHALRHYAVSTWIEAGLAPKTVQTFAGHSSLQVTMDRYGFMFKSDDHKTAMDTIARGFSNAEPNQHAVASIPLCRDRGRCFGCCASLGARACRRWRHRRDLRAQHQGDG